MKYLTGLTGTIVTLACLQCFSGSLYGQMVSPAIDRKDKPFSYFSQPVDQIGVAGSRTATEITPEGFLYTGYGEMVFFAGPEWKQLDIESGSRIRTLEDGYLPVVRYDVERGGIIYHFMMFAASLGEKQPEGSVANFTRVTAENRSAKPRAAFLAAGFRYQAPTNAEGMTGENRFNRPSGNQAGEDFNVAWAYGFNGDEALRDGKVTYIFPLEPKPVLRDTLVRGYNTPPTDAVRNMSVMPTTATTLATYTVVVPAGKTVSFEFKMPLAPMAQGSAEVKDLEAARFDDFHQRVVSYWKQAVDAGIQITVPEEKANDLFRTCLVNDLLALNYDGRNWIQTVNQLHYHGFYLRDSADFVRMYDATGYPKIAEQVLNYYATKQQPDGNFVSQKGQYDGWGQALWIFGYHVRFTHDHEFAQQVYPSVLRAVDWFEKQTAADPLHLMPATDLRDNEYVTGHLTGYNFLALDGLQGAIALAHELGKAEDAERFQRDYDALREDLMTALRQRTAENGGAIPPRLDATNGWGGTDWGNLLSVVPEPQLDPHDPMVTATLESSQSRYEEGLTVYERPDAGKFLHDYLIIKNTLTELVREDQQQAVREFYALLLHTSSTNAGFEYAIRPWGDRNFEGNLSPHGWFAADFRNLMRNMLVREKHDDTLHLLSAVSPEWIGGDKKIVVRNAATMFGPLNFELVSEAQGAELRLKTDFHHAPRKVIVHVPWFVELNSASVDGKPVRAGKGELEIPVTAHVVKFNWTTHNVPGMSYDSAVQAYKAEYAKRYQEYLTTGETFAK